MDYINNTNDKDSLEKMREMQLETILKISGSLIERETDNPNILIPNKYDIASSLVFKNLKNDKLNEDSLKKAIDTEVKELKPIIPQNTRNNYVPVEFYDEQSVKLEELGNENNFLFAANEDLSAEVSALKIDVENANYEKLATEQVNDALANQLDSTLAMVDNFSEQMSSAIQKSVEESIMRASLQAQNAGFKAQVEALIKQVDTLNSIVEGLQSQLGAVQQQQAIFQAAEASALAGNGIIVNNVLVVKGTPSAPAGEAQVVASINNGTGDSRWDYGSQLTFNNSDINPVDVTVTVYNPAGQNWLLCPVTSFRLEGSDSKDVDLIFAAGGASVGGGSSVAYGSNIQIVATRIDGSVAAGNIETRLNILNPDSY